MYPWTHKMDVDEPREEKVEKTVTEPPMNDLGVQIESFSPRFQYFRTETKQGHVKDVTKHVVPRFLSDVRSQLNPHYPFEKNGKGE